MISIFIFALPMPKFVIFDKRYRPVLTSYPCHNFYSSKEFLPFLMQRIPSRLLVPPVWGILLLHTLRIVKNHHYSILFPCHVSGLKPTSITSPFAPCENSIWIAPGAPFFLEFCPPNCFLRGRSASMSSTVVPNTLSPSLADLFPALTSCIFSPLFREVYDHFYRY